MKDWANRTNSYPINRNFFFVFENEIGAKTFVSVFNYALEGCEDTDETTSSSEVDEDDLYNETQPAVDPIFPDLF